MPLKLKLKVLISHTVSFKDKADSAGFFLKMSKQPHLCIPAGSLIEPLASATVTNSPSVCHATASLISYILCTHGRHPPDENGNDNHERRDDVLLRVCRTTHRRLTVDAMGGRTITVSHFCSIGSDEGPAMDKR